MQSCLASIRPKPVKIRKNGMSAAVDVAGLATAWVSRRRLSTIQGCTFSMTGIGSRNQRQVTKRQNLNFSWKCNKKATDKD